MIEMAQILTQWMLPILFYHITRGKSPSRSLANQSWESTFPAFRHSSPVYSLGPRRSSQPGTAGEQNNSRWVFKGLLYWLDLKLQHRLSVLCCSLQQLFCLNVPRKSLVLHRRHRRRSSPWGHQSHLRRDHHSQGTSSTNRRGQAESAGWFQSCCWQQVWFV